MRRFIAVVSGLCLGIGFYLFFLWTGNTSTFLLLATALGAGSGAISFGLDLWDRFGGKPLSQSNINPTGDVAGYIQGQLTTFAKEEDQFIPLRGEVQTQFNYLNQDVNNIDDVLDRLPQKRFVLIGDPGAGKTTTLRHLWRKQAQAYTGEASQLPLWIFLGRGDNPEDVHELLREWWQQWHLPDSVEKYLQQKRLFLFLDGLNEMPDETRQRRTEKLKAFIDDHPDLPVIITCRVRDYQEKIERPRHNDEDVPTQIVDKSRLSLGEKFPVVVAQPLDEFQIRTFIYKRLGNYALWDTITDDEGFLKLARNPYNLVMLISLSNPDGTLPDDLHNLNDLYRRYVKRRYDDYANYRDGTKIRLSWEQLQPKLETLAFRMIAHGHGTVADESWCRQQIGMNALRDGVDLGVLVADDGKVRFYHQSLHQHFALPRLSNALKKRWNDIVFLNRRVNFIRQIGDLGEAGSPAVDVLIDAIKDKDWLVQYSAVRALGSIEDIRAVKQLINALSYEDERVRGRAAKTLGRIGDVRAIEPLINTLNDDDKRVRGYASLALVKIGSSAVEPLINALNNEDVSYHVAQVLGNIRDNRAVQPLIRVLKNGKQDARYRAAEALGYIGDSDAIQPLVYALNDDNWRIRASVANALGQVRDSYAVEPLISTLNDEDESVRSYVAQALGTIGDSRAVEPLISTLNDNESWVRESAAEALKKIGTPEALEAAQKYWDNL